MGERWRRWAALGTLVAVASACGGGSAAADGDADERAASAEVRTVEGADGPVEIPAEPRRIVGDLMTLDYLTALGYDTDAVIGVFGAGFFPDDHYLADVLRRPGLVDPGFAHEANVEAIAAADPDLILAPFDQVDGAPALDELREVAPVLVVPTSEGRDPGVRYGGSASFQDWRSTLRAYGAVLGLEEEAEAYIAGTEQLLAEVRAEHGELIDAITVTEIKSTPDLLSINALDSALDSGVLGTIILSELGFRPPPQQAGVAPDEYGGIDLSAENLALIDGDLLFVEVREGATSHEESPLWETLDVVRSGGVVVVGNHWEYGGAVAARAVIADIDAALDDLAARR